jgi:RHH-type transcriptional regulator, proline utilization regulon repressor / proline dehydrogenase / delta 1-pyrroline-5-carboxylate dehydrogenase
MNARLPSPYREEAPIVAELLHSLSGRLDWPAVVAQATPWVQAVRDKPAPFWALESLLREYPISSAEGLALMRLAEALLRVPDAETAIALTADQLGRADFAGDGGGDSPHRLLATLSSSAIVLAKRWLPDVGEPPNLLERLGAKTIVAATVRAIQLLGRQFVLGRDIGEALDQAAAQRREQPHLRFSFDMLGEGARTDRDALRYLASYDGAIRAIVARQGGATQGAGGVLVRDGISIKLSALHPRYEDAQHARVMAELVPRLTPLLDLAAAADINLAIDAEESDRLELSLQVFDALAAHVQQHMPRWHGFGLAVQAYQTRVLDVVDETARIARARQLKFMVRLVKGAYWDAEIKRAQEGGFDSYPVFTHKQHTDIAYLAAARALIGHDAMIVPQFATHNAGTIAAIVQMAHARGARFEMQRLHGMGEGVYREVSATLPGLALRVYAPVGEHRDLLAYLVRRLLENGANSSFVHQLADATVAPAELLRSPLNALPGVGQPLPRDLYGPGRRNPVGVDLACPVQREPLLAAWAQSAVPVVREADMVQVDATMRRLHQGWSAWHAITVAERAALLERAADRLEARLATYCALLVREGKKTWGDCVAEVREAIDFCRYYALQGRARLAPMALPGPTGESNELRLHGRGVFVCISPWNFPLAIFAGQVVAALVAGNAVAAKPAEQTPGVAAVFVDLLHEAGVPADVLALLHGPGETVGAALVAHPLTAGVCFTGSTQVAKAIQRALAASDGPIVPLIAETGGLNAMVVDSTALPEQVVDAVVQSAFRSAGQRCSALRLLCVHDSIAPHLIEMLAGAMSELRIGTPEDLATDVGPVIDAEAHRNLTRHVQRLQHEARLLARTPIDARFAHTHVAPVAFEIDALESLREEVFGPVLHVVRWSGEVDALVARINALGYGLTLGIQTRIDSRALRIADITAVGNVYVNRNMIGAVVGVQPFGGEGLSGTGPKAGGPHYLYRFCAEQTLTVNTAAAGGNASLLAGTD